MTPEQIEALKTIHGQLQSAIRWNDAGGSSDTFTAQALAAALAVIGGFCEGCSGTGTHWRGECVACGGTGSPK